MRCDAIQHRDVILLNQNQTQLLSSIYAHETTLYFGPIPQPSNPIQCHPAFHFRSPSPFQFPRSSLISFPPGVIAYDR